MQTPTPAGIQKLTRLRTKQLVGGQAYSAHRDERIFPNAHIVDPLRWVSQEPETGKWVQREDVTPEMHASYFPFGVSCRAAPTRTHRRLTKCAGVGVRSCSGRALAEIELLLVAATMVGNFRMFLHESTTPESMR